jgi:hypothetical protein
MSLVEMNDVLHSPHADAKTLMRDVWTTDKIPAQTPNYTTQPRPANDWDRLLEEP